MQACIGLFISACERESKHMHICCYVLEEEVMVPTEGEEGGMGDKKKIFLGRGK